MWRYFFIFLMIYFSFSVQAFAGVFISAIFPNTTDDKNLEYIELINIWDTEMDISEYYLQDKSWKKYIFPEETLIESDEKVRYIRPNTKLILNNSNEEIYLYDNSDQVLDFLLYTKSEKWEVILWENIPEEMSWDNLDEIDEQQIPELWTDDDIGLLSWLFDADISDEEIEIEKVLFPEVRWDFQRPSYIENKDELLYLYSCEREDCKINLDLRDSFHSGMRESDYRCEIDFGFTTGQEERCNPNTVLFWTGSFDIEMKIFSKDEDKLLSQSKFILENIPDVSEETIDIQNQNASWDQSKISEVADAWEQEVLSDTILWEDDLENITESYTSDSEIILQDIEVPEIALWFQRPSYVELTNDVYLCDSSRNDCKINFDLRESFTNDMPERDYICQIDFWFKTWQEERCNPNTIIFSEWEHTIRFKIIHEDDESVFSEKQIRIKNTGYNPISVPQASNNSTSEIIIQRKYLAPATIDIQSGIEYKNGWYVCTKDSCRINLKHETSSDYESCIWAFWKWAQYNNGTQKRCNPGYVTYPKWEFTIYLQVYQDDLHTNFRESHISFVSKDIDEDLDSEQVLDTQETKNFQALEQSVSEEAQEEVSQELQILLQWKIAKTKQVEANKITCFETERCYVNFNSSGWDNKLWYSWDFWNGQISQMQNPKWIWFDEGNYSVVLSHWEVEEKFEVIVSSEKMAFQWGIKSKENTIEEIQYDYSLLRVWDVFPNPKWNDNKEWLEIQNTGNKKINLKWCYIDDIADGWSRAYKIKEDLFIKWKSSHRFYKLFTKLNLNNAWDSVSIVCKNVAIDTISWNFKVWDNLTINHTYPQWKYIYHTGRLSELSLVDYWIFVTKTFKQNERLLKSGFKISGETLPNARVKIILWNGMNDIYLTTDTDWLYEVLLKTWLKLGTISPIIEVNDSSGDVFIFESKKQLSITSEYIYSLIPKAKKKKTKKSTTKKPKTYLVSVANASDGWDERTKNNYDMLIFLIIVFWFLLGFFVMKRRWVLD